MIQSMQMLSVIQVPQHGFAVLAAAGAQRAIRRNSDGVQVARMTRVVGLDAAVGQVPYFNHAIPAGGHNDRVAVVWGEPDARHPIRVTIFLNRVLTFGQCVPQFDGFVAGTRYNLAVVYGERNR